MKTFSIYCSIFIVSAILIWRFSIHIFNPKVPSYAIQKYEDKDAICYILKSEQISCIYKLPAEYQQGVTNE